MTATTRQTQLETGQEESSSSRSTPRITCTTYYSICSATIKRGEGCFNGGRRPGRSFTSWYGSTSVCTSSLRQRHRPFAEE